ncbi:hypothetical protein GUITHDRAFT_150486 [Guillardia theta CCMP2712]|uniref:Ubiquitin-like domain-containing protein n=2 Tax=Guillardia theta TaxID=55529 RepID=L1JXZ2_GUITC|nr:hypothetical protein GUITHDRAFT_150486 [Guillardia theta CCMP2712]EKX52963.1 hypothetical protein GUITHDRAFT_150486 [Guillardia theta CCMP2712]|eukprot:XP_005839943.1 hypothetical protein GUITHDRAFT_150486 [Guillardia theta CCMP2712]
MERYGFDSSLKKSTPKNKTGFSHGRQTKQGRDGSMYTKMRFSREPSVVLPSKKPWHYAEFLDDNRLAGKIKVHADDRFGRKTSVYAKPTDTIQDLKVLIGEKIGRDPRSLILQKCKQVYNDKITLSDYEVHDGMNFELSYHRAYIFDT